MVNFSKIKIESLAPFIILALILLVLVGVTLAVLGVIAGLGFGGLFGSIGLTETLLFLIFVLQVRFYMVYTNKK
jgi:hypothetical protein